VVDNNQRIAGSCWLHLRGKAEYNASDHNVTLLRSAYLYTEFTETIIVIGTL